MNSLEHHFPLPDLESHKLDEIKQDLAKVAEPVDQPRRPMSGTGPYIGLAIAGVAGLLVWGWMRTRKV